MRRKKKRDDKGKGPGRGKERERFDLGHHFDHSTNALNHHLHTARTMVK